jgi:hypothetical protein
MTYVRFLCRAALMTVIPLLAATTAQAEHRARYSGTDGVVVAESRFGHGTVSGPVRAARFGREVRLPGGTWEACRRSCSETLRVSTVDFWETQSGFGAACGIFGCLELRYPR